jgi:hypothetical protein
LYGFPYTVDDELCWQMSEFLKIVSVMQRGLRPSPSLRLKFSRTSSIDELRRRPAATAHPLKFRNNPTMAGCDENAVIKTVQTE